MEWTRQPSNPHRRQHLGEESRVRTCLPVSTRTQSLVRCTLNPNPRHWSTPTPQQSLLHVFLRGTTTLLQVSSCLPSENLALAAQSSHTSRPPLKCTECGKDGHLCQRYWLLIGYPPGREPRNHRKPSFLGKPPSTANLAASTSSLVPGLSPKSY